MRDGLGGAVGVGRRVLAAVIVCGLCPILATAALADTMPGSRPKAPLAVQERINLELRYHFRDCWVWKGRRSADYTPC